MRQERSVKVVVVDYESHRECLHRVERSIDCNVAYPQALPVMAHTARTSAWYTHVSSAHNVTDVVDLIRRGISTHL